MTGNDVLVAVVSYNGLQETRRTVEALRAQVGHVHIVDNGSSIESRSVLESLARVPNVTVEWLGVNRGIGYALNRGVAYARAHGFTWLLTMDQDSVAAATMLSAYARAVAADPGLVCLTPQIQRPGASAVASGVVAYAITSGNLVRVDLFAHVGPYDEGFFIDCVDFDFCLRVRRAGHSVYRVSDAVMTHQLGESRAEPPAGGRFYVQHSPARRYYMYRNFGYLAQRYALEFPAFILKLALAQLILTVLIGVLDPHPLASYQAIARGVRDFVAQRSGPDLHATS